ncbi:MAG: NUDIX hydrolase [bacterium]|nr:NUDIX hydrolase [bacterium]
MKKVKFGKLKSKYKGKIFSISQREVTFPDGFKQTYEYCERAPSVSVLAFNEKNEILMIKERRHGYNKNVWFLPGGRADQPTETTRLAALRELEEETGYKASKIKMIHKKSPSNTLFWDIYIYCATDLKFVGKHPERGEHIVDVKFIPFKNAVKMALDGTIENEFISYNIIRFDYMLKNGEFKI